MFVEFTHGLHVFEMSVHLTSQLLTNNELVIPGLKSQSS